MMATDTQTRILRPSVMTVGPPNLPTPNLPFWFLPFFKKPKKTVRSLQKMVLTHGPVLAASRLRLRDNPLILRRRDDVLRRHVLRHRPST